MQLISGAVAGIEVLPLRERSERIIVSVPAGALIRRPAIPVQPQPAEILHDPLRILQPAPGGVKILDPQQNFAPLMLGGEPCKECGKGVAKMHAPAGRGGKTA